jgi:exodeoxyribonuclease V alpha subunit
MSGGFEAAASALVRGRANGVLSALDVQFATRLAALYDEASPEVMWGLAIACRQQSHGHVCADLARLASSGLTAEAAGEEISVPVLPEGSRLEDWLEALRASRLIESTSESSARSEPAPLILDGSARLYLRKSFEDQAALAEVIRHRAACADLAIDWDQAEAGIDRLVQTPMQSASPADRTDWTRQALRVGLARPLSIVTGGPGTGKTTMVAVLIALVIEEHLARGQAAPTIRLLAPTGKAAAAMTSAFLRQRETLEISDAVKKALPTTAETIHRALLARTRRDALGESTSLALEADIVVVDEASMVDLSLMRALFSACQDVGRIVLLGDPDQLASVDSGAVLAELAAARAETPVALDFADRARAGDSIRPSLRDSIVSLVESHRFASGGAIARLADAIRAGDAEAALALLQDPSVPEIELCEVDSVAKVRARLADSARQMQREIESVAPAQAKLDRLSSRRILCAHRRGPLGVETLCEILDDAAARARRTTSRSGWWPGRLLMVTRNAPDQDLWNGDVGLVEETETGLRALFSDVQGGVRSLSAGRLPAYESAIAMSVHKSQGSEFDEVDLVLGASASRLMTRELLYTGVTRARQRIRIHASVEVIRSALARRVERDSGLAELLVTEV